MKHSLLRHAVTFALAVSLTNCSSPRSANIIHGTPSGGSMPIYVMATYHDLKAGGLSAGFFRGWTQAEFEFLRLYPDRQICVRGVQSPECRGQMPIALVAVPKSYLTGEIPGSVALYHVMSGTGDLIGGAGSLLTGMAWFRGVKIGINGGSPLATASSNATGGSATATGGSSSSTSNSNSNSSSNSKSYSNSSSKSYSNSSAHSFQKLDKSFDCGPKTGHGGGGGYGGGYGGGKKY